jgi:hypothetical protein
LLVEHHLLSRFSGFSQFLLDSLDSLR